MKAESIEQIREHLARGGRAAAYFKRNWGHPPEVKMVHGTDGIYVKLKDGESTWFADPSIDHWELLPIDEKVKGHAGDCTIYASKGNGEPTDGICTCGHDLRMKREGKLLPIEDEKPLLGWRDAGTISSKESLSFRQATNRRMKILIDGEDTGAGERIRTALLYGRRPEMSDLLEWWQATTGERIEHGERCTVCDGTGQQVLNALTVRGVRNPVINQPCLACKDHPGYTVKPTWMEEQARDG